MTDSVIVIPDTNVLIHCKPLQDTDLRNEVDTRIVEVAVPLVVVDELDRLKNSPVSRISRRAASLLEILERAAFGDEYMHSNIVLSVAPDANGRDRLAWIDDEIMARCQEISHERNLEVILLTNDLGMRVRASARFAGSSRLTVQSVPESMIVTITDPRDEEIERLRSEAERRDQSGVNLNASFNGLPYMQAPPFRVVKHDPIEAIVQRRIATAPSIPEDSGHGLYRGPTSAQRREFNRDHQAWQREYREWVESKLHLLKLGEAAIRLTSLAVNNSGGTTAEDVELRVQIPEQFTDISLAMASEIGEAAGEKSPEPPEAPTLLNPFSSYKIPDVKPIFEPFRLWEIDENRQEAVTTIEKIRPNGKAIRFDDTLCIIPTSGSEPLVSGMSLRWQIFGSKPEYRNEGVLHMKPRATPNSPPATGSHSSSW